jgi:hypothetical protein
LAWVFSLCWFLPHFSWGLPGAVGSGAGPREGGHLAASISPWSSLMKAFAAASGEVFLK